MYFLFTSVEGEIKRMAKLMNFARLIFHNASKV